MKKKKTIRKKVTHVQSMIVKKITASRQIKEHSGKVKGNARRNKTENTRKK